MKILIGYLYPDLMNIYGDRGNVMTLLRRCKLRGIDVEVERLDPGDTIESGKYDIFFMGGGQDREQLLVSGDLLEIKGEAIRKDIENGACALVICGGYQLFGKFYRPFNGEELKGIGVFDAFSVAGNTRFIGNVVVRSQLGGSAGTLVGFENHSGRTYLGNGCSPLGMVTTGHGNNDEDGTEGAVYLGAVGTYLHGSILPKNPEVADFLIEKALLRKGYDRPLAPLDDTLENRARESAIARAEKRRKRT